MNNLSGHSIGRYHILEQLGEGGMATVYKAYDTRLERDVAVKVIRTDLFGSAVLAKILKRFEREARTLAKLSHPNIVKLHDFGEHDGSPYLVLEYLPGGTLKERIKRGALSWEDAVRLLIPIADALAYAHRHDTIHRDVKPANILLTENGSPMLTDFGIGKILETEETMTGLTGTGMGIGTPEYMAPEQWTGAASPQSDQYALGVVMYELLTGRRPYEAETPAAILLKQAHDPLPRPGKFAKDLPPALDRIFIKALAKDPQDRFKDMSTFKAALEGLVRGPDEKKAGWAGKTAAAPATVAHVEQTYDTFPVIQTKHRFPWAAVGIGGLVIVAVAAALLAIRSLTKASPASPPPEVATAPTMTEEMRPSPVPPPTKIQETPIPTESFEIGSISTRDSDGMAMMYVPEGDFLMGSNTYDDEKPIHPVTLDAYWMDQTEITNKMYALCVQDGGCQAPVRTGAYWVNDYYGNSQYGDYPVVNVDWNMADAYCGWAGARLPTEAEWEKAARGTDSRTYPWGEGIDCSRANFDVSCGFHTTEVGTYTTGKSPFGLFDMAGNVWEWVMDWYDSKYYRNSPSDNPQGPSNGLYKVLRGGSWVHVGNFTPAGDSGGDWYNYKSDLRAADRGRGVTSATDFSIGFRCARSIIP
jgi:serine/threonine-protein kinase